MKDAIPFELIVRLGPEDPNPDKIVPHSEGGTHVTGPLTVATNTIWRIITDDPEVGQGEA
jgi:hypothetical protein